MTSSSVIGEVEANLQALRAVSERYRQSAQEAREKAEAAAGYIRDEYQSLADLLDNAAVKNDRTAAETTAKVNSLLGRGAN